MKFAAESHTIEAVAPGIPRESMTQQTQADFDAAWRQDGERNGWQLPPSGLFVLQFAGIRHVRAALYERAIHNEARRMKVQGVGFGKPPQRELWILYAIYRGWC